MKRLITNLGLLQIFAAMLLVIVIMLASSYVMYRNSISAIYEKVAENSATMMKSVVREFDNNFRTINDIIYIVNRSPYSEISGSLPGSINMVKAHSLYDNIASLISSTEYIEDLVIFYDDLDLTVSGKGTASFTHTFDYKYRHKIYNGNFWRRYVQNNDTLRFFPVDEFDVPGSNSFRTRQNLMIALSGKQLLPSSKHIMVFIKEDLFLKRIDQRLIMPDSSFIILDQNRNLIMNTGEELDLVDVLSDLFPNSNRETSVTRGEYEYNLYKSEYNDFIYINRIPYKFQNISEVLQANTTIMLIAIISAIIVSIFLSVYLTIPVKRILRQLGGGHSKGNDFRKIHSGIVKMQQEYTLQREELQRVMAKATKGFLLEAIDKQPRTNEWKKQHFSYQLELFELMPFFAMMLIQVQAHTEQVTEMQHVDYDELLLQLQQNVKQDNVTVKAYHIGGNQCILLIGVDEKMERKWVVRQLSRFIYNYNKAKGNRYKLVSSVSKLYASDIHNCKYAYQDVVMGINYRHIHDRSGFIDIEAITYAWQIYFPFDRIGLLSNLLITGKLAEGKNIIRDILVKNLERNIHHSHFIRISNAIYFYILRNCEVSERENKDMFALDIHFMQRIEQAQTCTDFEEALFEVAEYVASQSKMAEESKLNSVSIARYIATHYTDDLHLDHMAEVFGTSPKYFSNYFKKVFGVNYIEYLNNVRLSHAKFYLGDTELTIAEISEKVGYANASTFTTTFKRFFGVSPSEYRKDS